MKEYENSETTANNPDSSSKWRMEFRATSYIALDPSIESLTSEGDGNMIFFSLLMRLMKMDKCKLD